MLYNELDLNLLKTFVAVAEFKSVSLASQKLYISQPAVTSSIKRLETFLGGSLFNRTNKGMNLTFEGEVFYSYCKNALSGLEKGIYTFSEYCNMNKGQINIGCSSTFIRKILINFIDKFTEKYPNISISITDGTNDKLIKLLKKGDVDISVLSTPIQESSNFEYTKILEIQDCFVASDKFSDLKDKLISKNELAKLPLILPAQTSNNRFHLEEMCVKNDIELFPKLETESFWLIIDFVKKGLGLGYVIRDFLKDELSKKELFEVKTNLEIAPREIVIAKQSSKVTSYAAQIFIKEIKEFYN